MMAGIIVQWYFQTAIQLLTILFLASLILLAGFFLIPLFNRFRFAFVNGLVSSVLFFSTGAMLAWQKDARNNPQWLGHYYSGKEAILVTLDEPLVEKTKSLKANASVSCLLQNGQSLPVKGKIILYFQKDSTLPLSYGSRILFKKPLQEIKNAGNPGGFDYKRYSLFQGITHQAFLKTGEFEVLEGKQENRFRKFIYQSRERILAILRKNIRGEKETGLAEALLIGYKNDLDLSLVQAYTNTGVVHIIAISGLHLGLIYWLLSFLLRPLKKKRETSWLNPVCIIAGLWLFSWLAGAQPSILRSAIMFTCIVLGESLSRKTSIYNTLAVSAFILLCINPYWLWDVGFQLSYAAVLSIILFMRPVYNWFYIPNKLLDLLWKMTAVTLAAQLLTVPVSIYHFHQFPNLFILTNFLAVPLSSAILLGEILLCVLSFIPSIALLLGKLLTWLISVMNGYIERIDTLSFSVWEGLQISFLQAILLVLVAAGTSYWLMEKSPSGLKLGLMALLGFTTLRSFSFIQREKQEKIIVYNIPQKRAIDIVSGRKHLFIGDSDLLSNDFSRNFHLKPSRILHRIQEVNALDEVVADKNYLGYRDKHILLLDENIVIPPGEPRPSIDLLVLSKNPKIYLKKLVASLDIRQVVFDGSVPAWKARYWKKDCDSLRIPWYDVTMGGAFVMNLR
jgi:competence protein ComEC